MLAQLALLAAGCAFAVLASPARAQGTAAPADPNLEHPARLITAKLDGRSISGLATHRQDATALRYGVLLFAGYPGILRLREEGGAIQFDLRGNFLVRSRRHFLDHETLVLMADAPTDQWLSFSQRFRETARYGADIAALIREATRVYGVSDWTFIGTSDGSVTAYHAARHNPDLARRLILTASVFLPSRSGPGLSGVDWEKLPAPLLWVHHENDPCPYTAYRTARDYAAKSASPLVTVRGGGPGSGNACEARTAHGFIGVESATVSAMHAWIKTGITPPDVGR